MTETSPKRQARMAVTWNVTGFAFTFLNGVFTARLLAPEERGVLATILTISTLSYIVSALGTNTAVRTFQPSVPAASFRAYFRISAKLLVLNSLVSMGIVAWFSWTNTIDFDGLYVLIWSLTALTFTSSQLLDVLNAVGLNSQSARANTFGHATTAFVLGVGFLLEGYALVFVIGAYFAGFAFRIVTLVVTIRGRKLDLGQMDPSHPHFLIKKGVRFWGMSLGETLTFRSDQLLLSALSTTYHVGIYAVAVTPAGLVQIISNSIGQVLFRQAAVHQLHARTIAKWMALVLSLTVGYALVLSLVAPWVIPLVFGTDYSEAVTIVRILLIGEVFLSVYNVLVRVLAGYNRPLPASLSSTAGFIVLVAAFFLLAPTHGAIGAAMAAVLSYFVMAGLVVVGVGKTLRTQLRSRTPNSKTA